MRKNDSDNTDSKDDNIFDNPVLPDEKDNRPTDVEDNLSDEEKKSGQRLTIPVTVSQ